MEDLYYADLEKLEEEYRSIIPNYKIFCNKLSLLVEELLLSEKINFHLIENRIKDVDSFMNKVMRNDKFYKNPLSEITDICGIRIILYYASDVDIVSDLIDKELNVTKESSVDKREQLAEDQFGYLSVHKIIALNDERKKLTEWSHYSNYKSEIQVRSVLQHAWAAISHALQYKRENEIPRLYRRKLIRLSGLLELADEEFISLKNSQDDLKEKISEVIEKRNYDVDINSHSVIEYFKDSQTIKNISKIIESTKLILTERMIESSETVLAASLINLNTIYDLDNALNSQLDIAKKFYTKFCETFKTKSEYTDMSGGIDHWIAVLLLGQFSKIENVNLDKTNLKWANFYKGAVQKAFQQKK